MKFGPSLIKFRQPLVVVIGIVTLAAALLWFRTPVRSFESVRESYRPSDVWVVDRNGHPLESVRTENHVRSLDWVKWRDVSPAFQTLLVQAEDRRFYSHRGVDFLALAKAAWERLWSNSLRGASTITMQLVGLLKDSNNSKRRNVFQKLSQMVSALRLENRWSKDEILEAYVNRVPFRGELVGLHSASLGFFGKHPSGLGQDEAAILVALLRAPNAAPERIAQRACHVLGALDCHSIEKLADEVLSKPYQIARTRELVPVLAKEFVEAEHGSSVIKTSLEFRIQELAVRLLREQLHALKNQNVRDGAVLVLETQTGRVVAYVANSGTASTSAWQVDGVQMRRQAGSTIKPFVYGTAFDRRLLKPTSLLEDSPADISVSYGKAYHPKNYDHVFRGMVSVADALGSSMNVPAVRALQLVGEEAVLERMRAAGIQPLQEDDYYGPSLALGAIDVSLWELTHGYRHFAVEESPFSGPTRASIFNILASSEHRRFTFGIDSVLTLPFLAAVKTGTSKDMRDNWCVGWTDKYTVGVWVGNFSGEPMWNVSGMSGAAPIWRSLMLSLHSGASQGVLSKYEEPSELLPRKTISRIRYPVSDMLVGIDPDIPLSLQKLPIEIDNPQQGQKVILNDRVLAKAQETTFWPLRRGRYVVELKTTSGELVDSVKFEVR